MRKYHGEPIPEKQEQKRSITTIHFLIHPGALNR